MRWLYRFRRRASVAEAPERLDPGHHALRKVERVVAQIDDTESATPVEVHRRYPPTLAVLDAASPLARLAPDGGTGRIQAPLTGDDVPTVAPGAIPANGTCVRVGVLGPLVVAVGEQQVTWGGSRNRSLFQYLLLHAGPVHREELMELLWTNHSYHSARNNLNVAVHGLRRALHTAGPGNDYVVYRDGCYGLHDGVRWSIDRDRFLGLALRARSSASHGRVPLAVATAADAVTLYRGSLFQDDLLMDWFAPERRWLHEQHVELLELEAGWQFGLGDVDGARLTVSRELREEPCRESAHRLLMRCYALQHQGDLVARQYQLCVTTLDKEFGIGPTSETVRLYEELADTA